MKVLRDCSFNGEPLDLADFDGDLMVTEKAEPGFTDGMHHSLKQILKMFSLCCEIKGLMAEDESFLENITVVRRLYTWTLSPVNH